jgi:predicted Ser/Thr protein kinase
MPEAKDSPGSKLVIPATPRHTTPVPRRRQTSKTFRFERDGPKTDVPRNQPEPDTPPTQPKTNIMDPEEQRHVQEMARQGSGKVEAPQISPPARTPASPTQETPAPATPKQGATKQATSAQKTPSAKATKPPPFDHLHSYRVRRLLGRGGMGAVYEGFDKGLDRHVALKVLAPELARNESSVARFLTEARAVARINHPNVVQIFYIGTDNDVHFFAMEYVAGDNLQEAVDNNGPLSPVLAIDYVIQAVQGLYEAQQRDIIHRDIKPANLLRTRDGTIKVMDFGLAKSNQETEDGLTKTGAIMGTPQFISPEQGQGLEVDHRSDIYSLGATLYYLLTGRPPYSGSNPMAIILQHIRQPEPQIERAPPSVNTLLRRMMAKDPKRRFGSYPDLLEHLHRLKRSGILRDRIVGDDTRGTDDPLPAVTQNGGDTARPPTPEQNLGTSEADLDLLKSIDEMLSGDE